VKFNKVYTPEEKEYRINIFVEAYNFVKDHNLKKTTWTAALNQYSDLTKEEKLIKYSVDYSTMKEPPAEDIQKSENRFVGKAAPDAIDWRALNKVTSVKNQGNCNSGFTFGTIESIESALAIENGMLQSMSAQQILDCTNNKDYGNKGCQGGSITNSFNYLKDISDPAKGFEGLTTDVWYPYIASAGRCQYDETLPSYQLLTYVQLGNSQAAIKNNVGLSGPVSAGVYFEPM
jgi:C1A family cysteine protease